MSTTPRPTSSDRVPEEYAALVDDAATLPPSRIPLAQALQRYAEHCAAAYSQAVGTFVVGDAHLPQLIDALGEATTPVPVAVVVAGGAGGVEPAVGWATSSPAVELRSVEVALQDTADLATNARRVVAAAQLFPDVPVHMEPPRLRGAPGHGWLAALDEVAAAELPLTLRCGAPDADLFPRSEEVAAFLEAALDRELAFSGAGLHSAVRHTAEDGSEHHGFLNVLLATRAALDGDDVVAALEERDREAVMARVREVGPEALVRTRRWFRSFRCGDVTGPVEELVGLGLMSL